MTLWSYLLESTGLDIVGWYDCVPGCNKKALCLHSLLPLQTHFWPRNQVFGTSKLHQTTHAWWPHARWDEPPFKTLCDQNFTRSCQSVCDRWVVSSSGMNAVLFLKMLSCSFVLFLLESLKRVCRSIPLFASRGGIQTEKWRWNATSFFGDLRWKSLESSILYFQPDILTILDNLKIISNLSEWSLLQSSCPVIWPFLSSCALLLSQRCSFAWTEWNDPFTS